ncbi:hypothetical protein ACWD4F_23490 [Streptomyces aureus]
MPSEHFPPEVVLQALRLGRVDPGTDDAAVLAAERLLSHPGWDRLVRQNKVTALAGANLQLMGRPRGPGHPLYAVGEALVAEPPRIDAESIATVRSLIAPWEERTGQRCVGIKGLAVRWWYPRPHLRAMSDLDLWLPDLDAAEGLADHLQTRGWAVAADEPPLIRANGRRQLGGVISMKPPASPLPPVDLQFGDIVAGPRSAVPLDTGTATAAPEGWRRTGDADTLLCLLAGITDRGWITGKDINDAWLLTQHSTLPWPVVARLLHRHPLAGAAGSLADAVASVYGTGPVDLRPAPGGYPVGEPPNATAVPPSDPVLPPAQPGPLPPWSTLILPPRLPLELP